MFYLISKQVYKIEFSKNIIFTAFLYIIVIVKHLKKKQINKIMFQNSKTINTSLKQFVTI